MSEQPFQSGMATESSSSMWQASTTSTLAIQRSSRKSEMKEHWKEHLLTQLHSGIKPSSSARTSTWLRLWVDVGTRYTTEDGAEPTYAGFKNWDKRSRGRNVTRPDRVLANKLAMEMIQSFQIVRESILPGHLPLKLTLNTAPFQQRITVVKVPKPFPIEEIEERKEEDCSTKAAELANRRREEIEQALRDGHDDQAWSLVSAVAESYLEWRCSSSKGDKRKGGKGRCGEPKTKECFLAASVGERSCDSPATKLTRKLQKSRRQAVEIQAKMNSRKAEEIDTRMQIIQLWTKIKKAIINNRVPCQPVCKKMIPEERDIQWFLNATQAMIKKIDKDAAERKIQNWLSKMKRVLNRRSGAKEVSKDWKALSNFIKKGRTPPITAVLVEDQENQGEGVESVQKTYAVETNEILQQIEKKWEPVFNRPKEASFQEFLERFRNYVQVQQCTIPELTGKDLKNKAKEFSLTRSVAMCGRRTAEIKTLPDEIFDLFAILFKRIEESQIWPEILLQVVTTFIPKIDDGDLDRVSQRKLACPAPEEMRPINNASPWYSIYTSLRYEQMESWRNEVMPSSMHGSRKDHGVWDVSLEHMLEMEAAVEKDQCLGALSLELVQVL